MLRIVLLAALTSLAVRPATHGPSNDADAATGPNVNVSLRIASQSRIFHIGELIPLEMVFTAEIPNCAAVIAGQDRYGRRIDRDQFHLEPSTGFSDPLEPYLNVLPENSFGAPPYVLSWLPAGKPQAFDFDLNQWLRFDKPGHYRLFIETNRVSEFKADETRKRRIPLVTNSVEFDVVESPSAWQKEQLTQIIQDLHDAPPQSNGDEPTPAVRRAMVRLRYLDTPESTRQLARELRGESLQLDRECLLGLVTSKSRDAAIDETKRLIADPKFPVSDRFLDALCWLTVQPDSSWWPQSTKEYRKEMEAVRLQLQEHVTAKTGYALAVSLETLIENPSRRLTERVDPASLNILTQTFLLLPSDEQTLWLSQQWPRVSGSQWIPVVSRIATRQIDVHFPIDSVASNALSLSVLALRRWYEIAPSAARPVVVSAIMRADQPYKATDLDFLVEKTLPEIQSRLAENLLSTKDPDVQRNVSSLLARYADTSVANGIIQRLDVAPESLDCIAQVNVAGWLLKATDPHAAEVLNQVSLSSCNELVFTQIGSLLDKNELVERLAISHLDDSNLIVAAEAVRYIRDHGTIISKQPVWDRLERWNKEWRNRMDELKRVSAANDPHQWDRDLGMELPQVLARARGWLMDIGELTKLKEESLEENGKQDVGACLADVRREGTLRITYEGLGGMFTLGCYHLISVDALKDKILQFPAGANFVWVDSRSPYFDVLDDRLSTEISIWSSANGRPIRVEPSAWLAHKDL